MVNSFNNDPRLRDADQVNQLGSFVSPNDSLGSFADPNQQQVPMSSLTQGLGGVAPTQVPGYNPQPSVDQQVTDSQGFQPAAGTPQLPDWQPDAATMQGIQQMVLHPNPKVRIATMQQLLPQIQKSITGYVNNMFAPNPMASTSTNSNMFQGSSVPQGPSAPPAGQPGQGPSLGG